MSYSMYFENPNCDWNMNSSSMQTPCQASIRSSKPRHCYQQFHQRQKYLLKRKHKTQKEDCPSGNIWHAPKEDGKERGGSLRKWERSKGGSSGDWIHADMNISPSSEYIGHNINSTMITWIAIHLFRTRSYQFYRCISLRFNKMWNIPEV